ncbi:hypothetical protein BH11PLA1_BH11PLA1_11260 [soil metagenome]
MAPPTSFSPPLAPPGAGVPALERIVGGFVLALRRRLGTPARISAQFERERRRIAALCAGHNDDTLSARTLIPRLRGLEDSSRFWSVWMTLDHLRIVNDAIARTVSDLMLNRSPEGTASTAAVKPRDNVDGQVSAAYQVSCDRLAALLVAGAESRSPLRYAHPWFGPLDARGWCTLASVHMGIHRAQIARILHAAPRGRA